MENIPILFENSGFYRREKTEKLKQDQYKIDLEKEKEGSYYISGFLIVIGIAMGQLPKWLKESELKEILKEGESDFIEKCESDKNKKKICKTICAFSNDLSGRDEVSVLFI